MTEVEYVIANFAERFADFRDKRIVLHGSRNYAEAIIENFVNSYNFIGVMSLDPLEGEFFHGLKVLREENLLVFQPDIVILTERVKYEVEAFKSIRHVCRINKIEIYNMYGLNEFLTHREAEDAVQIGLEEAKKLCENYDIIAFEVIDTLLTFQQNNCYVSPEKLFQGLIKHLRANKKVIRFSLRKSFPEDIQIRELKKFGFLYDVEHEIIKRAGEDLSFRRLKEENPSEKILYFGTGLANEFILPRYYGIDTFRFVANRGFNYLVPMHKRIKVNNLFSPRIKNEIEGQIQEHDLVSFDIFDTLLIRKTLHPQDVFVLTEQRALLTGHDVKGFANVRLKAEEEQPFCDIDQIYNWLEEHFDWSEDTTKEIKALEIDIEKEVLVPRTEVVELLCFAQRAGKRTVLTSNMYLSEPILREILEEKGIFGYEKIIVSCEIKKAKITGLFSELIRLCNNPDKILHIGDDPIADGASISLGISSILIPSPLEMAKSRGWDESILAASNLMERCLLGLIICKAFKNPFQSPHLTECSAEERLQRFGNCIIGPLSVGYMMWLIRKLKETVFDGVLFLARDGWIFYNIYQQLQNRLKLPNAIYYYANRHAAFLCYMDSEQETEQILERGRTHGLTVEDVLERVYQLPKNQLLPRMGDETALDYVEKHKEIIQKIAKDARKGYCRYSKKCGMKANGLYAVIDLFAVGSTQKYLSQFLPFRLRGFYFDNYTESADNQIEYYLQSRDSIISETYVVQLEPFLTSLEPSQNHMSEQGIPCFAKELRGAGELQEVQSVIESAIFYAREFFDIFYQVGGSISPSLIEKIYGAEDFHEMQRTMYDDWLKVPILIHNYTKKEKIK